jgi:O-antigen/teichoic acid export membrane protein
METSVSRLKIWMTRSLVVSVAPVIIFGSRLVRNVILSRLLIPHEFGAAMAISVVLGLAGLVTDVGLDRFVMVNRSARAMSAAHILFVLRAALLAIILVGIAPLIAALFGVPELAGSFALAALVPFFGGFMHLGIARIQINYNYGPESIAQLVANVVAIVAVFIAAIVLHDHRAIIAGFVVESLTYVVLSHVLAGTPYRLRADIATVRAALSFGLPLALNGVALATISQVDRVMVGHWFGVATLGIYAVILNIAVVPVSLILRTFGALGLSYLLSAKKDSPANSDDYQILVFVYSTLALLYAFFVILTLDVVTPLIFGSTFGVAPTVHVLIAVMVFLRLQRGGAPTIFLLRNGQTKELALMNLPASFGLVFALGFVLLWHHIESIVLGVVIGDFLVLLLFFVIAPSARAVSRGPVLIDFAIAFAVLAIIVGTFLLWPEANWQARGLVLVVGLLVIGMQSAFGLRRHERLKGLFFGLRESWSPCP